MKLFCCLIIAVLTIGFASSSRCEEKDVVAIIIDRTVYDEVKKEFDTYVRDVSLRFPVELVVLKDRNWESVSPDEIRAELQRLYKEKGIVGAVLVGQIPYTFWERSVDSHFTGINTLYYQELDGEFIDEDSDGRYEKINWGPNPGPELWVFWMRPPQKDSVRYLKKFLAKCHDFYTGKIRVPYRAMLYAETDYSHMYRDMIEPLIENYGTDNIVVGSWKFDANPRETPTLSSLESKGYESMTMNSHAYCMIHANIRTRHQDVLRYGGVLTMIYGCHTAAFDEAPTDNLTQGYVFRTKCGMAAGGTSWGAGIPPWKEEWLYRHLGEGMYLGKAYGMTERYDYTPELAEKMYGRDPKYFEDNLSINMIGNPFVYLMQGEKSGATDKEAVFLYRLIDKNNMRHDGGSKELLEKLRQESGEDKTDEELWSALAEKLGAGTILFNKLDDEAKKTLDNELSRMWKDFTRARKNGELKRAELISETMALMGKCALDGRGKGSTRRAIMKFLEREDFSETYRHVAALFGNMATIEDRDFLISLLAEVKDDPEKRASIAGALGHSCSHDELDWLLDFIRSADEDVAAAAGSSLDEIVTPEDMDKIAFILESGNAALRREYYSIAWQQVEPKQIVDWAEKYKDTIPSDVGYGLFRKRFKSPELAEVCKRTVFESDDDRAQNMALWLYSTQEITDGPEMMKRALTECTGRGVRRRALIEVRRWKDEVDFHDFLPCVEEKDLWICLTAIETVEEIAKKPIEQITGHIKRDYAEKCTEY